MLCLLCPLQAAKVCNNMVLAVSMAGLSEALALGMRLGLDPALLTTIFNTSSARCWSSEVYNPCPVRRGGGSVTELGAEAANGGRGVRHAGVEVWVLLVLAQNGASTAAVPQPLAATRVLLSQGKCGSPGGAAPCSTRISNWHSICVWKGAGGRVQHMCSAVHGMTP